MALGATNSCVVSAILSVVLFSAMQVFKVQLASSEWFTIGGGFLGSLLFCCLLTMVNNFENIAFGDNFQAKFVPEIFGCLAVSLLASGLVHRVCITTCFIFSCIHIYYLNQVSMKKYQVSITPSTTKTKSRQQKQKKH